MKKNKKESPSPAGPPSLEELEAAKLKAAELGHDVQTFVRNGDVVIGKCVRCRVSAVLLHEDPKPHGRMDGTAVTYKCTG